MEPVYMLIIKRAIMCGDIKLAVEMSGDKDHRYGQVRPPN